MVHFMKGLGAGLGGFALWLVASIFGVLMAYEEKNGKYVMGEINPFWYLLIILGFAIMIIGPIWYWLVKDLVSKYRTENNGLTTYFCYSCGAVVKSTDKFCEKCGTKRFN